MLFCLFLIVYVLASHRSDSDDDAVEMVDLVLQNLGGKAGVFMGVFVKRKILPGYRDLAVTCCLSLTVQGKTSL